MNKHAWDRRPGLAKDGPNQLPSSSLYDARARQNILDADVVLKRSKGDVFYLNSTNGQVTTVQQGANGQWFINSYHLRTSNVVPKEMP